MFTTDSPVDLRFMVWASPIIQDVRGHRRIKWVDTDTLDGSRSGTLRGYITDGGDDIRNAIVRVTLDSGWEHEVSLVTLMNASHRGGYTHRDA